MPVLIHHPDGYLAVDGLRARLDAVLFYHPTYSLPSGKISRRYDGSRHTVSSGDAQTDGGIPYAIGDAIIANWATIMLKSAALGGPDPGAPGGGSVLGYATAAQGAKADTAVQPNTMASLASLLTGYLYSLSPTTPVNVARNPGGVSSAPAVPTTGRFSSPTLRIVDDTARLLIDSTGQVASINFRFSGGSWAAPSAPGDNVGLFSINGTAFDGSAYPNTHAVALVATTAEAWTSTAHGTKLAISTTPIGSTSAVSRLVVDGAGNTTPGQDNVSSLGAASLRYAQLFAATGTINTSDAREKTGVRPLTTAELAAAQNLASEIGAFQFLASVAKKGDAAREHVGITVQRAIEVLESHGLDPRRYSFVCHDSWESWEDRWEGGEGTPARVETHPAGDRYSFRTDGLLLFIVRGLAQAQSDHEARIAALESRLAGGAL